MSISDERFASLLRGSSAAKAAVVREARGEPRPVVKPSDAPKGFAKLNLESQGDRLVGQCPACAEDGGDSLGNHLVVFPDGRFGCVKHQGDEGREHRSRIARFLNLKGGLKLPKRIDTSKEEKALAKTYAVLWKYIKKELGGKISDLGESAKIPSEPKEQFLTWCRLRPAGKLSWVGKRFDSHQAFARHLYDLADPIQAERAWETIECDMLDHTSGAHFHGKEGGRTKENLAGHIFLVVEHDGQKGKPTPLRAQVALLRYCQTVLSLKLLAVVSTAGKGFHGHFDASGLSADMLQQIIKTLASLGADEAVLRRCNTRIPGAIRQPDPDKPDKPFGGLQELLWLNPNLQP